MLKEFSSLLAKVLGPVFGNPLICFIAFVGLGVLLVAPVRFIAPFGLDALRAEYGIVISFGFGLFLLASLYHLVEFVCGKRRDSKWVDERRGEMRSRLERLTEGQKEILGRYVYGGELYLRLRVDEDVHGLTRAYILRGDHAVEIGFDMASFSRFEIDPWATEYLRKHPGLLEPGPRRGW